MLLLEVTITHCLRLFINVLFEGVHIIFINVSRNMLSFSKMQYYQKIYFQKYSLDKYFSLYSQKFHFIHFKLSFYIRY